MLNDALAEFPDQVPRRLQFEAAHPDVLIEFCGPYWRAVIDGPGGKDVVTRYDLRRLLDELERRLQRASYLPELGGAEGI